MKHIEFFFDCSSPWAYFAFHRIGPLARECGAHLRLRPILVGGVFNAVNRQIYALRADPSPPKAIYAEKSMQDWARHCGVAFSGMPPQHPVNSVCAMRLLTFLADDHEQTTALSRRLFEAYFVEHRDISDRSILAELCAEAGLDRSLVANADLPDVKEKLRTTTQELIDRGGFGSPTIFVDQTDMHFGNDALPLVRDALQRP